MMNILCPVCKNILYKEEKTYKCANRHSFDISAEGYLNLNRRNSQNTGDNRSMIRARNAFLNKGYYDFMRKAVDELISEDDSLVDLACGEGYYTAYFKAKDKIGIDLSKTGLKIAAKHDKTTLYLLNSIFNNPLEDDSADKIITIFAPIAGKEIYRILKDGGKFILVKPNTDHLFELKKAIYDKPYMNEVKDIPIEGLTLIKEIPVSSSAILSNEDLHNLFMMTPYINTTSQADKDKLDNYEQLEVTFSFLIDVYQK